MRQALLQKPRGAPRSKSVSLPPPIGGLNARDSVANMEPEDALVLDNWFPRTTDVAVRKGYTAHCTFTGNCETVVVYTGPTATEIFVAVNTTNDLIIDATTAGAISTAVVGGSGPTVQAITNSRWDYVNYGTAGGMFLSMVNGADTALEYDGTTWSTATLTHADLAGTDDLFTNAVYAERIWYGEKDSVQRLLPACPDKVGRDDEAQRGLVLQARRIAQLDRDRHRCRRRAHRLHRLRLDRGRGDCLRRERILRRRPTGCARRISASAARSARASAPGASSAPMR